VTDELLSGFGPDIGSWTLIPSSGGRFELTIDGDLVFSKKAEGRHPEVSELREKLAAAL
jgi:selenoprotein W-related protein